MSAAKWWLVLVCACTWSCKDYRHDLFGAADSGLANDTADAQVGSPDAGAASATRPGDAGAALRCGKHPCACDNGSDDDQDGLPDGLDPECTGAFDDDENSFATGLANKSGGCRDCYWDDNAGNGDDGCRYPAECLSGNVPSGNGSCSSCEVSQGCIEACLGRTPNGCDCFGCCEVVDPNGGSIFVELDEKCQLENLSDTVNCRRCIQHKTCVNPCGRCELCLGQTIAALPADCRTPSNSPGYTCDERPTCGVTADCQSLEYCQQGCCLIDLL